jgi:hypothetical protein
MVYMTCRLCLGVCGCYFTHCRTNVCHNVQCRGRERYREDRIVENIQTGQRHIYLSDPQENDGQRYMLPSILDSPDYVLILERLQEDETLIVQVREATLPLPNPFQFLLLPLALIMGVRPLAPDWDFRQPLRWSITEGQNGMQIFDCNPKTDEPLPLGEEPLVEGDDLYRLVDP